MEGGFQGLLAVESILHFLGGVFVTGTCKVLGSSKSSRECKRRVPLSRWERKKSKGWADMSIKVRWMSFSSAGCGTAMTKQRVTGIGRRSQQQSNKQKKIKGRPVPRMWLTTVFRWNQRQRDDLRCAVFATSYKKKSKYFGDGRLCEGRTPLWRSCYKRLGLSSELMLISMVSYIAPSMWRTIYSLCFECAFCCLGSDWGEWPVNSCLLTLSCTMEREGHRDWRIKGEASVMMNEREDG